MTNEELLAALQSLFNDIGTESFLEQAPLLAHYTTVHALESILINEELWFSNPLYMNDFEEVRFGINEGTNIFLESEEIKSACDSLQRHEIIKNALNHYFTIFEKEHIINTHVFCLSEHEREDNNGLLSMWRGYGGNGKGVAVVFDASKLNRLDESPLFLAKVSYATTEQRKAWITSKISEAA